MKKKVLYGVFMALVSVFAMGSLQSCTDDFSDFEHEYAFDKYNLDQTIAGMQSDIEACRTNCANEIAALKNRVSANEADIATIQELLNKKADQATLDKLAEDVAALQESYAALKEAQDNLEKNAATKAELQAAKEELQGLVTGVRTDLDNLSSEVKTKFEGYDSALEGINSDLDKLKTDVASALTDLADKTVEINAMKDELTSLHANDESLQKEIDQLTEIVEQAQKDIDGIKNEISNIYQEQATLSEMISQTYTALENDLANAKEELQNQIDDVKDALNALQDQIDFLTLRFNDLITSILIQATDSPVFGNFSLPLGVQSNLLFNWYFSNKDQRAYKFPNGASAYAFNEADYSADLANITVKKSFDVPAEYAELELGDVYLTINPVGHNVTSGKTFYLETSLGEAGRLGEIKVDPSEGEELMFGFSRSAANGFYKSSVKIEADNEEAISKIKVGLDEDLKAAGKDLVNALKDESGRARSAMTFLKAVYDKLNSSFPRYAVRAEWADPNKAEMNLYSVLSNYNLGVATAHPLSFGFYYGQGGINHSLPIIEGHIENLIEKIRDSKYLDFNISSKDFSVKVTLNAPENVDYTSGVEIKIYETDESGNIKKNEAGEEILLGKSDAQSMVDLNTKINKGVAEAFDAAGKDINKQIQDQIEDIIRKINDKIDGKINSIFDKIEEKGEPWFKRLDKLVDLYNKVAGKFNQFLADPNACLQPAMFYTTADGYGIVSRSAADPTPFDAAGGSAIALYPTTYTAEIVAPVYKKFIACVNVLDKNGNALSNGRDLANKVNSSADELATVIDGSNLRVTVPATNLENGKVYEFLYQALDYSGVTSTKKFYITVNK